jgi:hypothetical protein
MYLNRGLVMAPCVVRLFGEVTQLHGHHAPSVCALSRTARHNILAGSRREVVAGTALSHALRRSTVIAPDQRGDRRNDDLDVGSTRENAFDHSNVGGVASM